VLRALNRVSSGGINDRIRLRDYEQTGRGAVMKFIDIRALENSPSVAVLSDRARTEAALVLCFLALLERPLMQQSGLSPQR
jgi:hypothetical protein